MFVCFFVSVCLCLCMCVNVCAYMRVCSGAWMGVLGDGEQSVSREIICVKWS